MGRTLPTQVQLLHQEEAAWKEFRRALRKEDQEAFDQLWGHARRHGTACSMACRPLPFEAHLLAMAVGLQREILELKQFISTQAGGRPGDSPMANLNKTFSSREKRLTSDPPAL